MVSCSRAGARVLGVGAACAASVAAGLGLVFTLVTPDSVASLGTPELLGLLGLLVLPVAVLVALRAGRARGLGGQEVAVPAPAARDPAPAPAARREILLFAPDVRDTSGRRHRHRVVHPAAKAGAERVER